jgi:hypothetical protein
LPRGLELREQPHAAVTLARHPRPPQSAEPDVEVSSMRRLERKRGLAALAGGSDQQFVPDAPAWKIGISGFKRQDAADGTRDGADVAGGAWPIGLVDDLALPDDLA